MSNEMVYTMVDRSVLLPLYRRLLVEPALRFIPAWIQPNAITHAGHLATLIGTLPVLLLRPERGWVFAFAAAMVQLYCWCDNVDGAHARRTRQTSPVGEFLDHGLDVFSFGYAALLTCLAVDASPRWWVVMAVLVPGLAVAALWEQAVTGLYQLGAINQIEGLAALSAGLVVSAVFGTGVWATIGLGGIALDRVGLGAVALALLVGMLQAARRVWRASGTAGLSTGLPVLAVYALVVAAGFTGALGPVAAALGIGSNIFAALRMLHWRVQRRKPGFEPLLWGAAAVLLGLLGVRLAMEPVPPTAGLVIAAAICSLYAAAITRDVRADLAVFART